MRIDFGHVETDVSLLLFPCMETQGYAPLMTVHMRSGPQLVFKALMLVYAKNLQFMHTWGSWGCNEVREHAQRNV